MTRIESNPSPSHRGALCAVVALVLLAVAPADPASAAAKSDLVTSALAPTNTALLARASGAVARRLVAESRLQPGQRVGLRPEGEGKLDADMREALLRALNDRNIACVLLPGTAATGEAAAETAAAPPTDPVAPAAPGADGLGAFAEQAQRDFAALQAEREAQAARADSAARAGGTAPAKSAAAGDAADLPILTWRVQEARVDYVRQFRGGILGAQRIERRAHVDLALRLTPAGSDAIAWSATADTTIGDVVLKSEIAALEDRTRPETRPTPPSSSFTKVLEPALVVVLIAGLVSLFYQNRP